MMSAPLVSIIIPTKNSLPHLKNAIESVRCQTYRHFELIIQDGGSTDGTLEYLSTIRDLPKIDIRSEPDNGIGQAYNRGITRSQGDYLCLAASDERLFDDTIEKLLSWFHDHPSAAVIYGGSLLIDQEGKEKATFIPEPFNFSRFMKCELFPTTAALLNKKVIGKDLFYDESLKTCPDYDFWLRLGSHFSPEQFIHRREILMSCLADRTSMSFRVEAFEQFCKDKFFILDRFLFSSQNTFIKPSEIKIESLKTKSCIFCWAAKGVINLEGISSYAVKLCHEAEALSRQIDSPPPTASTLPHTFKFHNFVKLSNVIPRFHHLLQFIKRMPLLYRFVKLAKKFLLQQILTLDQPYPIQLKGGSYPWGYTLQAMFDETLIPKENCFYWVKILMKVTSGVVGVCLMHESTIQKEKLFTYKSGKIITYFPIQDTKNCSIIFRNGGLKNSVFEIYDLSILQSTTATEANSL